MDTSLLIVGLLGIIAVLLAAHIAIEFAKRHGAPKSTLDPAAERKPSPPRLVPPKVIADVICTRKDTLGNDVPYRLEPIILGIDKADKKIPYGQPPHIASSDTVGLILEVAGGSSRGATINEIVKYGFSVGIYTTPASVRWWVHNTIAEGLIHADSAGPAKNIRYVRTANARPFTVEKLHA